MVMSRSPGKLDYLDANYKQYYRCRDSGSLWKRSSHIESGKFFHYENDPKRPLTVSNYWIALDNKINK